MKRRAVLKRFGAAGVAGAAMTGTATARPPELGLDRALDVSSLSGEHAVADLLTEEEIAAVPDDVPVHEMTVTIPASLDTIETMDDCCCCSLPYNSCRVGQCCSSECRML